jgi:hypothetical protein
MAVDWQWSHAGMEPHRRDAQAGVQINVFLLFGCGVAA